jgi:hypothetical protein
LALFGALIEEIRFARDSPLEESGFEPLVEEQGDLARAEPIHQHADMDRQEHGDERAGADEMPISEASNPSDRP